VRERALGLAEPEGFVRTLVDEGPPMARLLRALSDRQSAASQSYLHKLLAVFEKEAIAKEPALRQSEGPMPEGRTTGSIPLSSIHRPPSPLVEPLSERELEVLRLIAEGLSNREIAQRLFLALNTVKVHTRNIYGKLGVHNRTQAVMQARDLGLL
jgi:LuxR family maltose regulon positive regulatory protein